MCDDDLDVPTPPQRYDLPTFVAGDTYTPIQIGPVLINGVPPAATLASAVINFKRAYDDLQPAYVLKNAPGAGQGTITITNASTWILTIPAQKIPLHATTWHWDLELTDAAGVTKTWIGGLLTVNPQV